MIKGVKDDLLKQSTEKVPVDIYFVDFPLHKKWETFKPRGSPSVLDAY